MKPAFRVPLLVGGAIALAAGVLAGLARLGWGAPRADLAPWHGPLMVCGFFGTVIALERAVALGARWAYLGPLFAAVCGLALVAGAPPATAAASAVFGAFVLVAASIAAYRRAPALHGLTLVMGALALLGGNALWFHDFGFASVIPAWLAFFVLTIAGERLELARVLPPKPVARRVFVLLVAVILAGAAIASFAPRAGTLVAALGCLGLAAWLARNDIARRTARAGKLTGFIGRALLSGYVWLAIGSIALLEGGAQYGSLATDAGLHAILLGFVFAMVIGHAPIIFPAILHVKLPYSPAFYVPLVLLHASVLLRVAGDALADAQMRAWGGIGNAIAVAAFVLTMAGTAVRAARSG